MVLHTVSGADFQFLKLMILFFKKQCFSDSTPWNEFCSAHGVPPNFLQVLRETHCGTSCHSSHISLLLFIYYPLKCPPPPTHPLCRQVRKNSMKLLVCTYVIIILVILAYLRNIFSLKERNCFFP